jgi:O-antigen/teichoic acid export membrane protein
MYAAAPAIAVFYNQPALISLTRVMSLILITNSLGLIHSVMLMKGIKFKVLAKISLLSVVISGFAGIVMAYNGFGVWSLAFQSLINSITRSSLLWVFNRWKPAITFSVEAFKRLFGFGSKLLLSGLLFQIFDNIYAVIIGKTYDSSRLGLYSQAKNMSSIPIGTVTSIIQTVSFPILSTIQNEDSRLRDGYRRVVKLVVCVTFPLSLLLIVVAKPLTVVLLTEKWLPVVPLFQLMCLAGLFFPLSTINLNILNVKGRPDIFLVLEIVKKTTIIVVLLFTARKGVVAIVMGQVLSNFVGSTLDLFYAGRIISYPLKEQVGDILPYFLAALAMAVVGFSVPPLLVQNYSLLLGMQVVFSMLTFLVVCTIFKLDGFFELLAISKNILRTPKFI